MLCACGSKKLYIECCEQFISQRRLAQTPEQLMRSRYVAYSKADINYIIQTMKGIEDFDPVEAQQWAQNVKWLKLDVIATTNILGKLPTVEFKAYYRADGKKHCLHEVSNFSFDNECWYYTGIAERQVK